MKRFLQRLSIAIDVFLHGMPRQPTIIQKRPRNMRRWGVRGRR
jgi:hypothetical protein